MGARVNDQMLVTELIKDGEWDLNPIADAVENRDLLAIQSIHLQEGNKGIDRIRWTGSKEGTYSVKKAYRIAQDEKKIQQMNKASTSYVIDSRLWTRIWTLNTIPRVRNFIWRIINNAVASKEALYKRKCSSNPLCPICDNEVETLEHLFLLCPWAKSVWFGSRLGFFVSEFDVTSIARWIEQHFMAQGVDDDFVQSYIANLFGLYGSEGVSGFLSGWNLILRLSSVKLIPSHAKLGLIVTLMVLLIH